MKIAVPVYRLHHEKGRNSLDNRLEEHVNFLFRKIEKNVNQISINRTTFLKPINRSIMHVQLDSLLSISLLDLSHSVSLKFHKCSHIQILALFLFFVFRPAETDSRLLKTACNLCKIAWILCLISFMAFLFTFFRGEIETTMVQKATN